MCLFCVLFVLSLFTSWVSCVAWVYVAVGGFVFVVVLDYVVSWFLFALCLQLCDYVVSWVYWFYWVLVCFVLSLAFGVSLVSLAYWVSWVAGAPWVSWVSWVSVVSVVSDAGFVFVVPLCFFYTF